MSETGENPVPERPRCSRPHAGALSALAQPVLTTACAVISVYSRGCCSSLGEGLAHSSIGSEWQRQNLNLRLTDSITSLVCLQRNKEKSKEGAWTLETVG